MSVPSVVVDASVAVKWFLAEDEAGVERALELLRGHADGAHVLAAPDLLRLEVLSALRSHGLRGAPLAESARRLEGLHLEWFRVDATLAEAAAAQADRLTPYDAVYAALAEQLGAELVTVDKRLAGAKACRARLL